MQAVRPPVYILKEGTDTSQGKPQLLTNITACSEVASMLETTLGPCGMDKLIKTGTKMVITNDGATIVDYLDVEHPAARLFCDVSRNQDVEYGDGTTSVVVLGSSILQAMRKLIEGNACPVKIVESLRRARSLCLTALDSLRITLTEQELKFIAETALSSKVVSKDKRILSDYIVKAVKRSEGDESLFSRLLVLGGAVEDSELVEGVVFKKCFSYAGFEMQPKKIQKPKILVLNIELELKAEKDSEVRIERVSDYQGVVEAEYNIIYKKLNQIEKLGANVVISRKAIGDLAMEFFAERGIFSAGRVEEEDVNRLLNATGAQLLTTLTGFSHEDLGTCEGFEERLVGGERYNFFVGCHDKSTTLVLKGGDNAFLEEADRSIHDAVMAVTRCSEGLEAVVGGGAVEMELSKSMRKAAQEAQGVDHMVFLGIAQALESIPSQLIKNCGFDVNLLMPQLRFLHSDSPYHGVDVHEGVAEKKKQCVFEPYKNKRGVIANAFDVACCILEVDATLKEKPFENKIERG